MVVRPVRTAVDGFLVCVLLLLRCRSSSACDVCDGIAAKKVASGQVLEISDEGLRRLAPSHNPLALLLYKPWEAKGERLQRIYDEVAAFFKREGMAIVMAQIDVSQFPAVTAALSVADVELPCVRVLRGDDRFGYPLRLGGGINAMALADALSAEYEATFNGGGASRLAPDALAAFEQSMEGTRVVGRGLTHPRSVRAFEQVAHSLRGAIRFALPAASAPSAPRPVGGDLGGDAASPPPPPSSASPPSEPPSAASAGIGADTKRSTLREEQIVLLRERSADIDGEVPELRMPSAVDSSISRGSGGVGSSGGGAEELGGGGLSAATLYTWVRWASLPSVFALTPASAATYLSEGCSGIFFVPGASGSNKTRDYALRRMRKLAERLRREGEHGIWLLWADSADEAHARLRAQLGLPPPFTDAASAGADAAGGSAGTSVGSAPEIEFCYRGDGRQPHQRKVRDAATVFVRGGARLFRGLAARRAQGPGGALGAAATAWLGRSCSPCCARCAQVVARARSDDDVEPARRYRQRWEEDETGLIKIPVRGRRVIPRASPCPPYPPAPRYRWLCLL